MSGRPAPPGRRGSVKKEAFKSDDASSTISVAAAPVGVEQPNAADKLKLEREEEMKRAMELRKKAMEDEAVEEKREQEARKAALAQERAKEAKVAEMESRQREQAAQKAAVEAAQKKSEEENARLAQIESARIAERSRKLAEEEERRAGLRAQGQSEAARMESCIAADMAPKRVVDESQDDLEYQREQEQQRQALEDARKKRELAEAQRQADQQEMARKQQQLEEQQRRMDEKLAKQKELLAEAAAGELRAQEEARRKQAELRQQQEAEQREQLAAHKAAEQAEIDRLRAEEEDRQRQALAALKREQEEHDAEVLRMEQERAAAAEEALRAEQAISQFESAALDEKRRRAEAQRQKRAMFLNEMDNFSTTFEAKTQVQEDSIKQEQEKHYELLGQQMKQVEDAKADLLAKEAAEKEQRRRAALATAQVAAAVSPPLSAPVPAAPAPSNAYSIALDADSTSRNLLGDLSSTLFTSASTSDALPMDLPLDAGGAELALAMEEGDEEGAAAGDSQELRVPTRIGSGKPKPKGPFKPAPVAVINAKATAAIQRYSEDEEEEGTGGVDSISNVLTLEERRKMTLAQKETWRAKQADLTEKRKDFHGVVTYTFDGVFSWQMYGSAEAVDETGSNYTEYLMRCQWGTTFENMQPWIVAHRYKEFDALDQALKRKFPRLEANMPKLPKKDLFRALNSDVVAERRAILEEYMSKIVSSMPSLLRSELVNDFLDITNRISAIRLMLLKASNARVQAEASGTALPADSEATGKGTVATPPPAAKTTGVSSNSKYGIEDPLAYKSTLSPVPTGSEPFGGDVDDEPLYWNMDDAEEARAAKNARSLDEDQLGLLEIDVRSLGQLLRKGDNKSLVAKDSKFRAKYKTVSKRWPNLRATAVVGMGVDFTLIPRAMQVEEDLVRFVNEFRNIETASTLTARMTAV